MISEEPLHGAKEERNSLQTTYNKKEDWTVLVAPCVRTASYNTWSLEWKIEGVERRTSGRKQLLDNFQKGEDTAI